jgi:hypothetical protein
MVEMMKIGLDGLVLVMLFIAGISFAAEARFVPLKKSIAALFVLAVIAGAVLSCTGRQTPERSTSEERCVDLVVASCGKMSACFNIPPEACLQTVPQCAMLEGITQAEADICMEAITQSTCEVEVPRVCERIAEPKKLATSPQPESREL